MLYILKKLDLILVVIAFLCGVSFSGHSSERMLLSDKAILQDTLKETVTDSVKVDTLNVDSVKIDTIKVDTVKIDTTASDTTVKIRPKVFTSDTMRVRGGVLPISKEQFFDEQARVAGTYDTLQLRKLKIKRVKGDSTASDTVRGLSFGNVAALSIVVPGFGQIHNKQYWKLPVLYATSGTFIGMTVHASKQFKYYRGEYENAVRDKLPQAQQDELLRKRNSFNTQKTLFLAGAALSYLYFVGDAAINYKGDVHPTRKATILSAIMPGAGQIYNKSYWKLPIVYGGFATFAYIIDYNNRGYQRFKRAYQLSQDGDDSTVDEFGGRYTASFLQNTRDSYRRYRDLGLIMICGFYVLNIIDAHVDAYLRRYDVSDNLAVRIEPSYQPKTYLSSGKSTSSLGLAMKVEF